MCSSRPSFSQYRAPEDIDFVQVIATVDLRIAFPTKYLARRSRKRSRDESSTTMVPARQGPRAKEKHNLTTKARRTRKFRTVRCASTRSPDGAQRSPESFGGKIFADRWQTRYAIGSFRRGILGKKSFLRSESRNVILRPFDISRDQLRRTIWFS